MRIKRNREKKKKYRGNVSLVSLAQPRMPALGVEERRKSMTAAQHASLLHGFTTSSNTQDLHASADIEK